MRKHHSIHILYAIVLLICMAPFSNLKSQLVINAELSELIETARSGSSASLIAKTRLENQYWRNVSFDAGFKPQLSLTAILPDINRVISSIPLPSGEEAFVNRSFMNNSVGLQVFQRVPQTGGSFFVSTEIRRLDLFRTSTQNQSTSYLSNPLNIGFTQPLFQFNSIKWEQELMELQYTQAEKRYVEEYEMIAVEVVNRFFDLYQTELNLATALDNQNYLDSLANTARKRHELGRIGETEMLQVGLSALNADALVSNLEQDKQNKTEALRDYLGIKEEVQFDLKDPGEIEAYIIDADRALLFANENRSDITDFSIRIKNAQLELEQAKQANKPDLTINGSFGLTNSAERFGDVFNGLNDQESVRLSINIPIADWGRTKAQRKLAESSIEIEELLIQEEKISFQRDIEVAIEQLSLVRNRLTLAKTALDIADKRQDITKKRYQLGKQDATNLNIAIQEYAGAERSYYQALWEMWQTHYRIRLLTLHDFQNNTPLVAPEIDKE